MSVTSGFFNSLNGDRKYNAEQMSAIFDGIINDGVFASIGTAFAVNASGSDNEITVGIGRAWFNSAWIYNDTLLPLTADDSELVLNRYDAVVIEIDHSDSGRTGSIKIVKGTPASTPEYPTLTKNDYVNQHPLAYIYRAAGSTVINQGNITNRVGTSDCPYITGILQVVNIDNVVAQWEGQWETWSAQWTQWEAAWNQWFSEQSQEVDADTSEWLSEMQSMFDSWFEGLQAILEGDVATNLAAAVVDLNERFETLAKEQAVYEEIQDSSDDTLEDSSGNPISGRTIFGATTGSGGADIGDITPDKIGAAAAVHAHRHAIGGSDPITPAMIGAPSIPIIKGVTLSSTNWIDLTQVVSVSGVLADELAQKITVAPAASSRAAYIDAEIQCISQGANRLTFEAGKVPSQNLVVLVTIEEVKQA